jgi:hypothetical protein
MILTYKDLGTNGRLGNQLFQIASTIGIGKKNNYEYFFPEWICKYSKKNYSDFFEKKIPILKQVINPINLKEKNFHFSEINLDMKNNYNLIGYFQSEKYFIDYKKEIREYFTLKQDLVEKLKEKFKNILSNSCSLHIRRGDYLNLQEFHPVLDLEYYNSAIKKIYNSDTKNINFLIFSDDLDWCKNNIKIESKTLNFIKQNDEILDLFLMSFCENNIIANSSFSWWGAWLNENENKKIVAPKKWFGDNYIQNNTKDLYCDKWIVN